MAEQVDVAHAREWLQEGRPVTVLVVRLDEDRAQWSIPGTMVDFWGWRSNQRLPALSSRLP